MSEIVVAIKVGNGIAKTTVHADGIQFHVNEGAACLELYEGGEQVAEFRNWVWYAHRSNLISWDYSGDVDD